jgi:CRP/FNR family transcriptional regulator, cyclic AMP receptor protein
MTEPERVSYSALAAAVLKRCAWFGDCSPDSQKEIVDAGKIRVLNKGAVLSRRGESINELAMVIDGVLEVSVTSQSGKRRVMRYLEPGQMMNLIPFIDEQGAIHDATAHTALVLLLIGRPLFARITRAEPDLVHRLLRLLCLRSRLLYAESADTSFMTLRQRCASALLQLVEPYGEVGSQGVSISLKLSQEELADMVGCSRPMINRELKELEQDGAIKTTYSHYVVTNLALLQAIASADPG